MAQANAVQANTHKLEHIAETASDVLMTATTVFPFTLFPDTVTIDRIKVTINRRLFFGVEKVTSIQVEDILNAEANAGPLLGSVKLWTRFFADKPLRVNYLTAEDAREIQQILQGYIIVRHKKIDCTKIEKHELVKLLRELGQQAGTQHG